MRECKCSNRTRILLIDLLLFFAVEISLCFRIFCEC